MKEGLWKRFKDMSHHIIQDSLSISKSHDCYYGEMPFTTFEIRFSVPDFYDFKASVLFRWFIRKLYKAIKER